MKESRKMKEYNAEKKSFSRQITEIPICPFCGLPIERPKELETRRPGEMPVGSCSCGAIYAYDATGHNLGAAFIEALVFGCNMDWDLAWGLLPEEDYLEKIVKHYDYQTHLIVPGGFFNGRRISGALYFVRMHQDIQEVTGEGVKKKLDKALPVSANQSNKYIEKKTFTKREIEKMVKEYQVDSLLKIASLDNKVVNKLQRLLYSDDELIRLRAAEILGRVSAVIVQENPGTISNLLQRLFTSVLDSAASSWGAIDAIGEIISNSPEIFAGYTPALYQLLNDESLQAKTLRAIGKIAKVRPDLIRKPASYFISILRSTNPETRGYAALLLGHLKASEAKSELERIQDEKQIINTYKDGQFEKKTVGQMASKALKKIK